MTQPIAQPAAKRTRPAGAIRGRVKVTVELLPDSNLERTFSIR